MPRIERRRLGRHGLEVTSLCLGTMPFGAQIDEAQSRDILDTAFEKGIRFIDTANAYPLGATHETLGRTEEIIGTWLADRNIREKVVLATKCFAPMGRLPNASGLSRLAIVREAEASLKRLKTDYIDLYQSHFFDTRTPIEETLRAFEDLTTAGKVRYVGCSNHPAWRLANALHAADKLGIAGYASVQPRYNLLFREIETELLPLCKDRGVGVICYNPMAGGFLSGKYKVDEAPPDGTRFAIGGERYSRRYWQEAQFRAVETLKTITEAKGLNLVSVAIAWVLRQPAITAAIVGATKPEQLDASIASMEVEFDDELTAACEAAWWSLPRRPISEGYYIEE